MGDEPASTVFRELAAARVRARVDRELHDDSVVPVLVIYDGTTCLSIAGDDPKAAARAARRIVAEARMFADQVEDEARRGGEPCAETT